MLAVLFLPQWSANDVQKLQLKSKKRAKKGKAKNVANKAKHSKLIAQKSNKVKLQKINNAKKLKAIIKKANETKND